ncbi:MAG TPA: amidohydrolase family protein [Amycolatopsis sp.]|nr:amidohydrolase family protein [Amycolatopsis sp.]
MIDGIPIFDCVIHVYDMSEGNVRASEPTSEHARAHIAGLQAPTRMLPQNAHYPVTVRWSPEEVYDMVFTHGGTDLGMAQTVPIYDWFDDWFAPVRAQYEMARRYPEQVLFCGGVDPVGQGPDEALRQIEVQVREMGARSFKFYNGHLEGSWRCDDRELAYPLYRKCLDLGVDVIQFHKGSPFGQQNMEDLSPLDLQRAARDFPDLKFIIHHAAFPYIEEAVNIASRFPNIYIALSGTINAYFIAPRKVQEWIGRMLGEVGVDKLLWGSEAALQGNPRPYLESFVHDFHIPDDLRTGYGYPQITRQDKEKILGTNFARLMKVDLPLAEPAQPAAAS